MKWVCVMGKSKRQINFRSRISLAAFLCAFVVALSSVLSAICPLVPNVRTVRASVGTMMNEDSEHANYARYYIGGTNNHRDQGTNNSLFTTTGSGINQTVLTELLAILNSNEIGGINSTKTALNFSNIATDGTSIGQGGLYIRLFEPTTDGTNGNVAKFTTSQYANHGTIGEGKWWRMTYLCDGILTLYMADPYTATTFGRYNTYSTTTVRDQILTDFMGSSSATTPTSNSVLGKFPSAVGMIATGLDVLWDDNQGDSSVWGGTQMTNQPIPDSDRIFLPSHYEITNATSTVNAECGDRTSYIGKTGQTKCGGLWQMNAYDAGYSSGSTDFIDSWLRSTDNGNYAGKNDATGVRSYFDLYSSSSKTSGVRPAINIKLSALPQPVTYSDIFRNIQQ